MSDRKRQILQEFDSIAESHSGGLKMAKENIKHDFSFAQIKDLLKNRRETFDYKVTRMLNSYGYNNLGIRSELDEIWENISISQAKPKKYLRPLKYLTLIAGSMVDDTMELKKEIWDSYTYDAKELITEIIDE